MKPADHFSRQATAYARFRPGYPADLFSYLAELCHSRDLVWDVATGNGQAALALCAHFKRVLATDLSQAQLSQAPPHEKITYLTESCERSSLADVSVDLITVAQALHWFAGDDFYREVRRVACPRAVFAAWGYGLHRFHHPPLDELVGDFYHNVVAPYWPAGREHLDSGYATLPFPFERLPTPDFVLRLNWNREEYLGYLSSWSAVQRYRNILKQNPLVDVQKRLQALWPEADETRELTFPLFLLVARLP